MDQHAVILIIDDSAASLKICKGLLSEEFDVRLAKSGKLALAALEKIRPDVILLDIEMPDMTGFEVINEIKQKNNFKDIPVIFVTSHATERLVVKAIEHGAAGYVVKPFDAKVLRSKIQEVLNAK